MQPMQGGGSTSYETTVTTLQDNLDKGTHASVNLDRSIHLVFSVRHPPPPKKHIPFKTSNTKQTEVSKSRNIPLCIARNCLSVLKIFSEIYFLSLIFYLISSNLPHRFHRPSNLTKVKAKSRHFKRTVFFSFFLRMLLDYNEIKTYCKTVNDLK